MATKSNLVLNVNEFYKVTYNENQKEEAGFFTGLSPKNSYVFKGLNGEDFMRKPDKVTVSTFTAALDSAIKAVSKQTEDEYNDNHSNADLLKYNIVKAWSEANPGGTKMIVTKSPSTDPGEQNIEQHEKTVEDLIFEDLSMLTNIDEFRSECEKRGLSLEHKVHGKVIFVNVLPSKQDNSILTLTYETPGGGIVGGHQLPTLSEHFTIVYDQA